MADIPKLTGVRITEYTEDAQLECERFLEPVHKGESWFIPAGSGEVKISGKADVIITEVN